MKACVYYTAVHKKTAVIDIIYVKLVLVTWLLIQSGAWLLAVLNWTGNSPNMKAKRG